MVGADAETGEDSCQNVITSGSQVQESRASLTLVSINMIGQPGQQAV